MMENFENKPPLSHEDFPDRHMAPLFFRASITAFRYYIWVEPKAVLNGGAKPDPDATQHFLPPDAEDVALGAAAHDALRQSRWIGLDHPDFWRVMQRKWTHEEFFGPLLQRAGVKTRRTLYRGARHLSMLLRDGIITLSAMDYDGPGAWEGVKSRPKTELPDSISDADLGGAIRAELAKSRPG
jgi:hypothetical protein